MNTIGQNSPATPVPSTALPSGALHQAGVGEDRHERPERRRRERDPEQPPRRIDAGDVEHDPDAETERRARSPSRRSRARRSSAARASRSPRGRRRRRGTRARGSRGRATYASVLAQPSTSGPITIPSTISTTTVGRMIVRCMRERSAARLEAASTSTSESRSGGATVRTRGAPMAREEPRGSSGGGRGVS